MEKMKVELRLLGFIYLTLTITLSSITNFFIESKYYNTNFSPCTRSEIEGSDISNGSTSHGHKVLDYTIHSSSRHVLSSAMKNDCKHVLRNSIDLYLSWQTHMACFICFMQIEGAPGCQYSGALMNSLTHTEFSSDISSLSKSEMASFIATSSVTIVVAAEEETKQAIANDLQSIHSSPCEWFVCDEEITYTRHFFIQGSESFSSWQDFFFFEPIKFEGLEVLVHKGIYEVAKGIYEQMLPEIYSHLYTHGEDARFRFTGHSLGGSLSVLMNLMLLIRGVVPMSLLLLVITFDSPSIMCGGDYLLKTSFSSYWQWLVHSLTHLKQ